MLKIKIGNKINKISDKEIINLENKKLIKTIDFYKDKEPPSLPLRAITLMTEYNIPEGKKLGVKLKEIEEKWVENNFNISKLEVQKIIKN